MPVGSAGQFSASSSLQRLSDSLESISLDSEKDHWVEIDAPNAPNARKPHNVDMRTVSEKELLDRADAQKLHVLIKKGDYQLIDYMLKTQGPHLVDVKNKDGMTALYVAISGSCIPNRKEVIDTLMSFKPNVNEGTNKGDTPVKAAVEFGRNQSIVKDLIEAGANVDQKGAKGITARQAFEASNRESLTTLFRR